MAQRAEADSDLAGSLDVTEAEMWSDIDRLLSSDVMTDPGPEWHSMAEIAKHYPRVGVNFLTAWVAEQVQAGRIEARRGPDRVTGKVMTLYRVMDSLATSPSCCTHARTR